MGERRGIPRACEQIYGGAGLGEAVGVLVPVLDEGVVGNAQCMLVVVEVELIVGEALGLEPVLGALFGFRVTAGDQGNLITSRQADERGLGAGHDPQRPADFRVEKLEDPDQLLLGDSVGHVVVLGHMLLLQGDPVQLPEHGPQAGVGLGQHVVNVNAQNRSSASSHEWPSPANSFIAAFARRRTSSLASLSAAVSAGLAASPPNLPRRNAASMRTPGSGSLVSTLLSGATVS